MRWFNNIRIGPKLVIGFLIVACITLAIGVTGIYNIKKINELDNQLYEKMTVPLGDLVVIAESYHKISGNVRDVINAENEPQVQSFESNIEQSSNEINEKLDSFEATIMTEDESILVDNIRKYMGQYDAVIAEIIQLKRAGNLDRALNLERGEVTRIKYDLETNLGRLIDLKVELAQKVALDNDAQGRSATMLSIAIIAIGVIISILLGVFISSSIKKPLDKLRLVADKLAIGDINVYLDEPTKDEIGDLTRSFGLMADNVIKQAEIAERIVQGDLSIDVVPSSEKDLLGKSLRSVVATLRGLVDETKMLTVAAANGELDTRGNADAFEGGFKDIIDGINTTLDGITKPLSISLEAINKLAMGEEIDALENRFEGQYSILIDNINMVRNSIRTLTLETVKLTEAAAEGQLSYRADTSKLIGGYGMIVNGINRALDSVIAPIQEASGVLQEMAKGNLNVRMEGDYKGDNAELKEAINSTIEGLLGYINEISNALVEIGEGNLDIIISDDFEGNFVEIRDSLVNIIESLNEMMGEINEAANQVATGSVQVSDGSQALSQGSTEQASSLEELTASIHEIAEQTKRNALNANETDEYARLALKKASEGNQQMVEMLQAMQAINESSQNISKIIKVIDDIAFQTNILALNAAVEAARAGQHGKGFAVVAEEVRTLAARSATAANETTGLIEGSIDKVKVGTKIANDTAEALSEILEEIEKAASLAKEIANASNEQATGISQIDKGIEQVSQVVQNNSATAEESAAASEELSSQAELLKQLVARFKLNTNRQALLGGDDAEPIYALDDSSDGEEIEIKLNDDEFDKY
jgi:methyl-accepting chemotaxis protein